MSVQFRIDVISGNSAQAINNVVGGLEQGTRSANGFNSAIDRIGQKAFVFNNISTAVGGIVSEFNAAVQPGIDFNSSLTDMSAITGVTGDALDVLGGNARQLAKDFGIDAAGAVEANKLLLSQLSPEIAKNSEALDGMTRNASVLSKQLKGDVAAATGILTTAMNQYGVSVDDPIAATKTMTEMMNIMSAGAKEGSAELPQISAALEQSGMMAKTANVSFAELNAGIQILDKSGKKGAEGGVALRNIMAKLSEGEFLPKSALTVLEAAGISTSALSDKSLSLSQRLAALKPIAGDTAAMTQLFGTENVAAGIALVNNTQTLDDLTGKIVGTNTATEMANTVMGSFSERMARTNAWLKDVGISLFNATSGFIPFIQMGMGGLQMMANLGGAIQAVSIVSNTTFGKAIAKAVVGVGSMFTAMGGWIVSTVSATAAQLGLNIAMSANPIGLMVVGITAAVGAVAVFITYWDEITGAIASFGNWILEHNPFAWLINVAEVVFPGFKQKMSELWDWIADKFDKLFGWIGDAWDGITSLFGGDDEEGAASAVKTVATNPADWAQYDANGKATYGFAVPGVTTPAPATEGISIPFLQGTTPPVTPTPPKPKTKTPKTAKEAASNITSGGSKPTTINLTIHKLQDQTVIHTTNLKEGAKQSADALVQMMLEALGGINPTLVGQ